MSQRQIDIADMQCWVFRKAQEKWGVSPEECCSIFKEFNILGYIKECYELLHVSGYDHALDDIENLLRAKGVAYD